ncbi:capsular exopolysaccharide biosynthesis protein [Burkholderiales bacterium JOSHI_001]|nr:capsular exopolysaccharide biosynthesis protein [Burkholderiales bacterium JOSHI_001]
MARFRDSQMSDLQYRDTTVQDVATGDNQVTDRSIGDIMGAAKNFSAEQVEKILEYQRSKGIRFGEAAVALGLATPDDVLHALAEQFHYPYSQNEGRSKQGRELVMLHQPFSHQAESFRAMRSQVMMRVFNGGEVRGALAVVSPDSGDGKTFFSANLGVALAQLGGRTLVVDADMRGPRMHEIFGVDNSSGLSGILSGRAENKVIRQVEGVPSLFVLPVGITPPNPVELVERPAFGLLMRELTNKFDHVVVDTPAAVYGADCGVIAGKCGAALVVARRNASQVHAIQDLVAFLSESPAKLAGVIFNEF